MKIALDVALQHHPDRAFLLPRTAHLKPTVVTDPDPEGIRNPWRTYRACLETLPHGATHLLVLQDDALVCDGFLRVARAALKHRPDSPVTFFVPTAMRRGSRLLLQACGRGSNWANLGYHEPWIPVVALCWPAALVPGFLEWADARGFGPDRRRADDGIVGRWARESRTDVWATVPSLVEHPDDVDSLIGTKKRILRQAICFWDGVTPIDWSS